jgi:hypothetical protein
MDYFRRPFWTNASVGSDCRPIGREKSGVPLKSTQQGLGWSLGGRKMCFQPQVDISFFSSHVLKGFSELIRRRSLKFSHFLNEYTLVALACLK